MDVIRLADSLPRNRAADVIARQLLRSGTSVGANYRAASRGRANSDVIAKLGVVEDEADESVDWMESLVDSQLVSPGQLTALNKEGDELLAMTVASVKTLRNRK